MNLCLPSHGALSECFDAELFRVEFVFAAAYSEKINQSLCTHPVCDEMPLAGAPVDRISISPSVRKK